MTAPPEPRPDFRSAPADRRLPTTTARRTATGPRTAEPQPATSLVDGLRNAFGPAGRRLLARLPPPLKPWVFAVEDTSVQITWRALGPGPVRVRAADTTVEVPTDGGPGSVVLHDLPPDRPVPITIDGEGAVIPRALGRRTQGRPAEDTTRLPYAWRNLVAHTLAAPPGEELFRFATISDLHIGAYQFGFRHTMVEQPPPTEPHPVRAARTALAELESWGAQLLVVKGDLTNGGRQREWDEVARLLATLHIPVEIMPGNHDHYGRAGAPDPFEALGPHGHVMTRDVASRDVDGLRIVLANSTVAPHGHGHIRQHTAAVVDELATTSMPAFVTMHHYAQRLAIPTFWPPGIPSGEANRFLGAVAAAKPATMISSGHTHRHRRRHVGPLVWTEVGSPKDYPGTWAGYVVHEGGIRQVVRRIMPPDLLRWTDYTAAAALGAWGLWSPGVLSHRCFTHPWPTATVF